MTDDDRITLDMIRSAAAAYERRQGREPSAAMILAGGDDAASIVRAMQLLWHPEFDLAAATARAVIA